MAEWDILIRNGTIYDGSGRPGESGDVAIASAGAKDADGQQWKGGLLAQRLNANEVEVAITMARPSER